MNHLPHSTQMLLTCLLWMLNEYKMLLPSLSLDERSWITQHHSWKNLTGLLFHSVSSSKPDFLCTRHCKEMAQPISMNCWSHTHAAEVEWGQQMTPHDFKYQPLNMWRMEIGRSVCLDPRWAMTYRRMSNSLLRYTHSRLPLRNIFLNKPTLNDILNSVSWNAHKQLDLLHVNECVCVCVCVWVLLAFVCRATFSFDIFIDWLFIFSLWCVIFHFMELAP